MADDRLEQIHDRYRMDLDADEDTVLNDLAWLLDEVDSLREILVFADGAAVTGLHLSLADLYAKDCEWVQKALSRAGCHPRGREHSPC